MTNSQFIKNINNEIKINNQFFDLGLISDAERQVQNIKLKVQKIKFKKQICNK